MMEFRVESMPGTTVTVGSEGDIAVRENGAVIRMLDNKQADDLAHVLERAARHARGELIADGV